MLRRSLIFGLLLAGITSSPVLAEDAKIADAVTERTRPELDAQGVSVGSLNLFPKIDVGLVQDSNIYATDKVEVDDLIAIIAPELILKSDWNRNELEIGVDWVAARHNDISLEDYDDWRLWGEGRVDVGRGELRGLLRHSNLHQPRTSPDNRGGITPTLYTSDEFSVDYGQPFGQFTGGFEFERRALDYDDTIRLTGVVDNDDRDRKRNDLKFRVGHQTTPGLQPFLQLALTEVNYDQQFDRNGYDRSSEGFDLVGGTEIDLSGNTVGEVFFGYIRRNYDDPRFLQVDGPIFGAEVTWNVTGLTTMIFSADRLLDGTTIDGVAGIVNTGIGIQLDHELIRSLILSLDLAANNEDFQGIDRDDDIYRASLEGIYMMNRHLHIRFGYEYQARNTSPVNSGGFEYRIQQLFIGLDAQI
jgi:hypothetical protein